MTNLAHLGMFTLGQAQLGAQQGTIPVSDSFSISDSVLFNIEINVAESFVIAEAMSFTLTIPLADAFTIVESLLTFDAEAFAGVLGKIVLRMDVDSTDFCAMVEESGMSIEVNDVPARAFTFIKQRGQKFDAGVEILPGDAVMFSCPTDPEVEIGDLIKFDLYTFEIIHIVNHYFDGNIIYRKSALRKIRAIPPLPQLINLVASENLDGKTNLTWDTIDLELFPTFDYYEVFEGTSDPTFGILTATRTPTNVFRVDGDQSSYFSVGDSIIIYDGPAANNGFFTVKSVIYQGGADKTDIETEEDIPADAGAGGSILNDTSPKGMFPRETTKTNKVSIKNLVENTPYYYIVRAVDKYSNRGYFSIPVVTPTDLTPPAPPSGVR